MALVTSCNFHVVQAKLKKARKKIEAYHDSRIGNVQYYHLRSIDDDATLKQR
jgi:hypothetical protein